MQAARRRKRPRRSARRRLHAASLPQSPSSAAPALRIPVVDTSCICFRQMTYHLSRGVKKFLGGSLATARYFLGVDGGGTRCRARLRDSSGRELRHRVGPASNIYVDFDAAMRVVRETVDSVIAADTARQEIAVGVGLAGVSEAKEAERVAAALPDFARVVVVNDAVAACVGAKAIGAHEGSHRIIDHDDARKVRQ